MLGDTPTPKQTDPTQNADNPSTEAPSTHTTLMHNHPHARTYIFKNPHRAGTVKVTTATDETTPAD